MRGVLSLRLLGRASYRHVVQDDVSVLHYMQQGKGIVIDGVLYVRQSDRLGFLELLMEWSREKRN